METPKLMVDSSDTDGKAEIVMDYILSWALRWADLKYACVKPILHKKCKFIMCRFLQIPSSDLDLVSFSDIKVWKESHNIDLWVELKVERNGKPNNSAILIENKYYTGLHLTRDADGIYRNQLEVYKKKFDAYYANKPEIWDLNYVVYTCIENTNPNFTMYDMAKDYGFRVISFYEVRLDNEPTESDIFNEFWLNW